MSKPRAAAVRTFLAVELPAEARERLAQIQRELAPHASVLKLVNADAMHITLRFLGDVETGNIPDVEVAAGDAARSVPRFSLTLDRLGTFPGGRGRPRVVWAGLKDDRGYQLLASLFRRVEDGLDLHGFGRETRAFSPHLTLARVREDRPAAEYEGLREAIEQLRDALQPPERFDVSELIVFRSDLSPRGPRYTALARLPLTAA